MLTASIISRRTRHLLIQKNASLYRQFSGKSDAAKGSGLRRIRSNTTPASQKRSATQPPKETAREEGKYTSADPHAIANEMVFSATTIEGRTAGTEAIASITKEQKLSNYAMASGLLAFVSYIFYYSLSSVGGEENAKQFFMGDGSEGNDGEAKVNPGFEEFLKEASEGRSEEERKLEDERVARGEARELAELEHTTAARLKAEGVEDEIVASANKDEEREMAKAAGFEETSGKEVKKRPLWKKVVFFWRRE
eukprot:CAMPEP_0201723130 /NCGR_PEP_ID=MMETSP0593-20130828/7276_1 /ASSEMBLY_ACC=CAM_ASM_000672 /TAXON_ID=267983 /ORGANISM="Skeletonema japonicum, Strain CCMP2506" /LENGTH=251 /DNA_ID=CAMNT_0048214183 /DNA_START=36 /DNA_END=791 /DNA_ORIENTATION=-